MLSFLDLQALVQLHAATAKPVPAVRQRLNATRCARHWLELTRHVPPRFDTPGFASHRLREAARIAAYKQRLEAEGSDGKVAEAELYSQVT